MTQHLTDVLHVIGQAILIPCLIVLIFLIIVTIWQIGDFIFELFLYKAQRRVDGTKLLHNIKKVELADTAAIIENSLLPKSHKHALLDILKSEGYEEESLVALAEQLLAKEENRYSKVLWSTDIVCRLGPMFGLLGTLIPLGPGIVALGMGDTSKLSSSMGVAFDTTISGLISAAVCFVISSIRKHWYKQRMVTLETLMECLIQEVKKNVRK